MNSLRVTLLVVCLLESWESVELRPFPEDGGTVTQTGEPSHFQVDDKAAEIEVNANPAGVKVNAKPASLQVVAKPGTPAIPIYHPAIHLAQHYAPPPIIHHHPALFYHNGYSFPFSHNWWFNGIKRHEFPKARNIEAKTKTHKSDIPHVHDKKGVSQKRQFIYGLPHSEPQSPLVNFGSSGELGNLRKYGGYGYGIVPQYASLGSSLSPYGMRQGSQLGLFQSPSQLHSQPLSQVPGLSRSFVSSQGPSGEDDNTYRMTKLYSELNTLATLYSTLLGRGLYSSRGFGSSSSLGYGALPFSDEGSGLGVVPSALGYSGLSGSSVGYGRTYIPSPLSQLYRSQVSPQYTGLLGASLMGRQAVSPYVYLPSMLQRSSIVGRSYVPGAKKSRKHMRHDPKQTKQKTVSKRQALFEPILDDDASNLEDLLQESSSPDYKRQLIVAPALRTMQNLQSLGALTPQQPLQLQQLQLRQLQRQLQQQLQPQQPPPTTGLQQLAEYNSLEPSALRYLTPSLVTPMENAGSNLFGGSSAGLSAPLTSPLSSPSLVPSTVGQQVFSNAFDRPQPGFNTLQGISRRQLLRDRSYFRNPLKFGYPSLSGGIRKPEYRRRLHKFDKYEMEDPLKPELLGNESITQEGSYSTEDVPSSEGETLLNSPVGFGPITVEAKTAEGARAAMAAGEDKRFNIVKPADGKHAKKQ